MPLKFKFIFIDLKFMNTSFNDYLEFYSVIE
jgi:hypothetical protein